MHLYYKTSFLGNKSVENFKELPKEGWSVVYVQDWD